MAVKKVLEVPSEELVVKKVAFSIYDIFWGIGWDQWERVKVIPKHSAIIHLKGQKHPKELDGQIVSQV